MAIFTERAGLVTAMPSEAEIFLNPDIYGQGDIRKILSMLGDGKLTDGGRTSVTFRRFLRSVALDAFPNFLETVLSSPSTGLIFQDLINALGERLNFKVIYGRYKGKKGAIGFDGFWRYSGVNLIVECKTTDAYRISTDTLLGYSSKVQFEFELEEPPSILLVVGRIDTGDIEAQIRGSRADDRISVISADSLLSLAVAMGELSNGPASEGLRSVLLPRDYTRLDELSSLLTNLISEAQYASYEEANSHGKTSSFRAGSLQTVEEIREAVLVSEKNAGELLQQVQGSKTQFENINSQKFILLVSKRYSRADQQFWYSINSTWIEEWKLSGGGLILGLAGYNSYYKILWVDLEELLKKLNAIGQGNKKAWHAGIRENDSGVELLLPKTNELLDLDPFGRRYC